MKSALVVLVVLVAVGASLAFPSTSPGPSDDEGPGGEPDGAPAPGPLQAARELYDNDAAQVRRVTDSAFEAAFPTWELYHVVEPVGDAGIHHSMGWNGVAGYDVTKEYNTILALSGAAIVAAGDAIKYAQPFAQRGNTELQTDRRVVGSSDSSWLGRTVSDPAATFWLGVWTVTLATWTQNNGVLANWTAKFDSTSLSLARWRTWDGQVGPYDFDHHARNFRGGVWVNNSYSGSAHSLTVRVEEEGVWRTLHTTLDDVPVTEVWTGTNYDGSMWRAYYPSADLPTNTTPIVDVAKALVAGGVSAYENMTKRNFGNPQSSCYNQTNEAPNWGFDSKDPDCVLRIEIWPHENYLLALQLVQFISNPDFGDSPNVTIRVILTYRELLSAYGFYTSESAFDIGNVGRVLMGHELFHTLQDVVNDLNPNWRHYFESQARAAQSFDVPGIEYESSTLWVKGGMNAYAADTSVGMCEANLYYRYSLYWGYLYWRDGGLDFYSRFLQNVKDKQDCKGDIAYSITKTLQDLGDDPNLSVAHSDVNETLADFAVHLYAKNFTWGRENDGPGGSGYDWGSKLSNVSADAHGQGSANYTVGEWGMRFVRPNATAPYNLTVTASDPGNWRLRLFDRDCSGALSVSGLISGQAVAVTPYDCALGDHVVNAIRQSRDAGDFRVDTT